MLQTLLVSEQKLWQGRSFIPRHTKKHSLFGGPRSLVGKHPRQQRLKQRLSSSPPRPSPDGPGLSGAGPPKTIPKPVRPSETTSQQSLGPGWASKPPQNHPHSRSSSCPEKCSLRPWCLCLVGVWPPKHVGQGSAQDDPLSGPVRPELCLGQKNTSTNPARVRGPRHPSPRNLRSSAGARAL